MDKRATLKKLQAKLTEFQSNIDDDLKPFVDEIKDDIKDKIEREIQIERLNKQAQKLITAWNKTIAPITGLKALGAYWIDDLGWFNLDIEHEDGKQPRGLYMGDNIKESLQAITSKQPEMLKYRAKH